MPKAVLVMDMQNHVLVATFCIVTRMQVLTVARLWKYQELLILKHTKDQIGVHFGNCRRRWKCVGSTRSHVSLSRRIDLVGKLV